MGVQDRDLGHVSDDVARVLDKFGEKGEGAVWSAYDPASKEKKVLAGTEDRAQRRVPPHERHVPQPGLRPGPGLAPDLLPDGRAGPVVPGPARRSC